MSNPSKRTCEACGVDISHRNSRARFCSSACSKRKPCIRCGAPKGSSTQGARYCGPCTEIIAMNKGDFVRAADRARHRRRREDAIAAGTLSRRRVAPEGQKWCARCQRFLPVSSFGGNSAGRAKLAAYCIPCSNDYNHEARLGRVYGLTSQQYDDLLMLQDGRCAICLTRPRKRRLAVDHDHDSGEIRGLLCTRCNHGLLGRAHDSQSMLIRALAYLRNPPAQTGQPIADDSDEQADLEFINEQCPFMKDGEIAKHATRDYIAMTPASALALAQAAGYALIVGDVRFEPSAQLAIDDMELVRQLHQAFTDPDTETP